MTQLEISEDARRDLSAIYRHGFLAFGLRQADQYIDGLLQTLDLIADYPEIARLRDSIDPPMRAYPHRSHVILYDLKEDGGALIVRIRHGLEDWQGHSGAKESSK